MENGTVKALVYTAPRSVVLQELPEPSIGRDDVLVQVAACGVCGSDLHGFHGRSRIRIPPLVMGHELTGRIAAMGDAVHGFAVGQRVVVQPVIGCGECQYCRAARPNICPRRRLIGAHLPGGFAEYVAAPARVVYPLPDGLSATHGAIVEPLGNALHMLGLAGAGIDRDVVVLGAGTLGLLAVAVARLGGARHIVVTDTLPHRLEVARQLGADVTVPAGPEATSAVHEVTRDGAAAVIDAAGVTAARQQAIAMAAPGATVVLLGNAEPASELPVIDIINREISLRGSYSCLDGEFRRAITLLADGTIELDSWLSRAALDEGPEIFERLTAEPDRLIKVVFEMGE
jgi:L-iditol 2-dehydrogenase